jgi:hypothetical protein
VVKITLIFFFFFQMKSSIAANAKTPKSPVFGFFFFEGEVITGLISYFNYRLYTMIVISAKNLNFVRFYLVLPQIITTSKISVLLNNLRKKLPIQIFFGEGRD